MSSEPATWRFLATGPCDGATNMALDEALLLSFNPSVSLPILRCYGWEPPALSLGRFQDAASLDRDRCHASGLTIVRRVTGGGAIYHADELTYSLVCAPRHLPSGLSVKESFRHLTTFLLRFYRSLGLDARYASDVCPDQPLGQRTAFCFAGKESCDIIIGGRKIGGNAQRRLRETIFQHGSIPLKNRVATGLTFMKEPPADVEAETLSLDEAGVTGTGIDLQERLRVAFREAMGVNLQDDRLSADEEHAVQCLREKYLDGGWNFDGIMH